MARRHRLHCIQDRLACIRRDLEAIDRTLKVLGYEDQASLDGQAPKRLRASYGRAEVARHIWDQLRTAGRPMATRDLSDAVMLAMELDARDRQKATDFRRRIGAHMRGYAKQGRVVRTEAADGSAALWERVRR